MLEYRKGEITQTLGPLLASSGLGLTTFIFRTHKVISGRLIRKLSVIQYKKERRRCDRANQILTKKYSHRILHYNDEIFKSIHFPKIKIKNLLTLLNKKLWQNNFWGEVSRKTFVIVLQSSLPLFFCLSYIHRKKCITEPTKVLLF